MRFAAANVKNKKNAQIGFAGCTLWTVLRKVFFG
jgi:hypothetical protein